MWLSTLSIYGHIAWLISEPQYQGLLYTKYQRVWSGLLASHDLACYPARPCTLS